MVQVRTSTREQDELVLAMLRLRNKGYGMTAIAEKLRCDRAFVAGTTHQVLNTDIKYGGEPEARIRKAYW